MIEEPSLENLDPAATGRLEWIGSVRGWRVSTSQIRTRVMGPAVLVTIRRPSGLKRTQLTVVSCIIGIATGFSFLPFQSRADLSLDAVASRPEVAQIFRKRSLLDMSIAVYLRMLPVGGFSPRLILDLAFPIPWLELAASPAVGL